MLVGLAVGAGGGGGSVCRDSSNVICDVDTRKREGGCTSMWLTRTSRRVS